LLAGGAVEVAAWLLLAVVSSFVDGAPSQICRPLRARGSSEMWSTLIPRWWPIGDGSGCLKISKEVVVISKTTTMEEQAGGSPEQRTDGFTSKKWLSQSNACVVERRRRAIRSSCHWWKKGLQSRLVKTINPGFRNRD
jgi:hypothetical protein